MGQVMWAKSWIVLRWTAKLIFTVLCVAVAIYAFTYLYRGFQPANPFHVQFAISGWDVPAHFFGAGLALLLAPLQLSAAVRDRLPRLHRLGGWLYTAAVLIGGASGLSLAMHAQGGAASGLGFALLGILWLSCTAIGIRHAIARDIPRHRRWMSRSIALTFAAVTLRLLLGFGLGVLQWPFLTVYVAAAWLCWTINLAVCELWWCWPVRRARRTATGRVAPTAATRSSLGVGRA